MKKNEDAAAKKKPKTSAAQIRVQKGAYVYLRPVWHLPDDSSFKVCVHTYVPALPAIGALLDDDFFKQI